MPSKIEKVSAEIEELRQELNRLIGKKGDVLDPEVIVVNERLDAKLRDYYRLLNLNKEYQHKRYNTPPDDIGMLDRVANIEFQLCQSTATWLEELLTSRAELPPLLISLHEKAAECLCDIVQLRHRLAFSANDRQ